MLGIISYVMIRAAEVLFGSGNRRGFNPVCI